MYTAKGQLDRDALIRQYSPLVRRLAHHMMAKLPPSVQVDDLIQVGLIGLSEALTRYEATQGVQFETFATQRIRGAMIDELRENDWMSRGSRKSQKEIEGALHRLEHRLGRSPSESEIAAELGMSLTDYQTLLGKVQGTQLVYLEDMSGSEGDDSFLDRHMVDDEGDPMQLLRNCNVTTVAPTIPVVAARSAPTKTTEMPRPPGTGPKSCAMVTRRSSAILERWSMMPMKMNSGMAISVSLSTSQ